MFEYKFEAHVGQHIVNCRAFTLREYKDLLQAKAENRIQEQVLKIINDCTDARNLNRQEAQLLLVKMWAHSLGEVNTEATWMCSCGKEIKVPINFTHIQMSEPEDLWYQFPQFQVKFKYPGLFDDSDKARMIATCIDFIVTGSEKLKVDDLTEAELDDLYSAITLDDIDKIAEMLLKPEIFMAVPISCECGKSHVHVIKGLKEFFKML